MNFGDILNQWDNSQVQKKPVQKGPQVSHKKANAPTAEDKDKIADDAAQSEKMHSLEYLKSLRPEAVLDLHQLTRDEAWERLSGFVTDCCRRNLHKILIIHGKGNHSHGSDPVLGPMVKTFIEQDRRLGTSGHPDRNNGGNGATWVIIKN